MQLYSKAISYRFILVDSKILDFLFMPKAKLSRRIYYSWKFVYFLLKSS